MFFLKKEDKKKKEQQEKEFTEQRMYKEGVTSVKDIIAPSAFKIEPDFVRIGDKYAQTLFVLTYPRYLTTNWLSPIVNLDAELDIAMYTYPMDSGVILKNLRDKVAQLQSQIAIEQEKGMVRDPVLETAYQDAEELRDKLQQGTERFYHFGLYFTVYGDSKKELRRAVSHVETILEARMVYTKPAIYQMEEAFNSTLPISHDQLGINSNMNTSPLSTTFPFVSSDLTSNDGILYGINRHNNSLILFDRFSMENANTVVFAKSGAGKSYAVKLEILRSMMQGTDVIVIDPEDEYRYLCNATGGSFLKISLGSKYRINPFDLPAPRKGESGEDVIRGHVTNLSGLIGLMVGELTAEESSIVDRALIETYAIHDIAPENPNWAKEEVPTMKDFAMVLENMEGGYEMAQTIKKYTEGTFAGIFNQPSNINMDNQFVVFNVRDMEDELRPIAMYVILNFIWGKIRSYLKKRILIVDEAWWMMQYEYSARFMFGLCKRARKYYLGVTTITQDVNDFLNSSYGKPIVTNSSIQLLLRQSPAAIDMVGDTFSLTDNENLLLLESPVGHGIFFAGLKHVAIQVVASYAEDQIITSDPRQLLEIEQAKAELAQQQQRQQKEVDQMENK